jgi:aspartyl protease family protein
MSDPDRALDFVYLFGMLVLVGSALLVRRLPIGQSLRMAGAWLVIFAAIFLIFAFKDELMGFGKGLIGRDEQAVGSSQELRIRKSADGHFWVNGSINDTPVRFLVDSGATVTSISRNAADRAGLDYQGGFPVLVNTANGTITMRRARAASLKAGPILRGAIAVHVFESSSDTAVIGMNFLSTLRSWGVEGDYLVLRT